MEVLVDPFWNFLVVASVPENASAHCVRTWRGLIFGIFDQSYVTGQALGVFEDLYCHLRLCQTMLVRMGCYVSCRTRFEQL